VSDSRLLTHIPEEVDSATLLDGFLAWTNEANIDLYESQEEAILEVFSGHHVILTTPTGSGKSLVATAAHFEAIADGKRCWYTAPIKALVSEKFFSLCREFGSDNVGMITGDASVNPDAPIICCTQEILANVALRHGSDSPVDTAVMDEFHYYSDRDRGWAWQIPLLELQRTRFVLMSATLGPAKFFLNDLESRGSRTAVEVTGSIRPVPLEWSYRETTLLESIHDLIQMNRAPIYIVHFTQKAAAERAQALTSLDVLTREEKQRIREEISSFRFDSPFGKDVARFVKAGIGVHHAGLLPKYRLLVERLAQEGLLKLICGTDTLGVGVNVPIRTVLFSQLCKFDGHETAILTVRDFQQIAGRAGRKGFDNQGFVWCQAPEHHVENLKALQKAADDPKKRRKVQRKRPPERGYAHWDEKTFERLRVGNPEVLSSTFRVSHSMLLNVLDRPGDGCAALRRILTDNHESRPQQRIHIRQAIGMYRSLVSAGIVETLDKPDTQNRLVRVNIDLQAEFDLTGALSPFVPDAVELLDRDDISYALDVLTVVESVLENPGVVLRRQNDKARDELFTELKREGVDYEERLARLDEVEWPKPLKEFLYTTFDAWAVHHPWLGQENLRPKSIVRDLYERAMTFREYVNYYGIKGSEGVLLRYLTDAFKGLKKTVPDNSWTSELEDVFEWLGALVRQVDSSLLDEWERLQNPEQPGEEIRPQAIDITTQTRAFQVMIRNATFRWIQLFAQADYAGIAEQAEGALSDPEKVREVLSSYWEEFSEVVTDADARSAQWLVQTAGEKTRVVVEQIVCDPEGFNEWRFRGFVELEASREAGEAVTKLTEIVKL
jgi:superfamily II RNA helicase|tara:strand:- start:227 stop:2737 length:2511 start_codon:yes stop_codon:yes gene_type:complete